MSASLDESARPSKAKPSVFMSYSHKDKAFAAGLANSLRLAGIEVWIDEIGLKIGDSLIERISRAIAEAGFLVAVISSNSVDSRWVQTELQLAMTKEVEEGRVRVLPIRIDDCRMPEFLKHKLFGDFSSVDTYAANLDRLLRSIRPDPTSSKDESSTLIPPKGSSGSRTDVRLSPEDAGAFVVDSLVQKNPVRVKVQIKADARALASAIEECGKNHHLEQEVLLQRLDSLCAVGATLLDYDELTLFRDVIAAYRATCSRADLLFQLTASELDKSIPADLWLRVQVIRRVYALGAVAVSAGKYSYVHLLVDAKADWQQEADDVLWIRHTQMMLARGLGGEPAEWIKRIVSLVAERPWLAPLVGISEEDRLVSVCQFDFMQYIFSWLASGGGRYHAFPTFAAFYKRRVSPAMSAILDDRSILGRLKELGNLDGLLADAVNSIANYQEVASFRWSSEPWENARVQTFLSRREPNAS